MSGNTTTIETYSRKCDVTGDLFNEGFLVNDTTYVKDIKNVWPLLKAQGYASLDEAYDDGAYYYTEWECDEDAEYVVINNCEPIEIDANAVEANGLNSYLLDMVQAA